MEDNEEYIEIAKNIIKRRFLLLMGLIFICVLNFYFFFVTFVIKGNEVSYLILFAIMLISLIIYTIYYGRVGMRYMYKSNYRWGRVIFALPSLFYAIYTIEEGLSHSIFNFEFFAYFILSVVLYHIVFEFNSKDLKPTKKNNLPLIGSIVGVLLIPIFIIAAYFSPIEISVLNFSRTLQYEVAPDGASLVVSGYYQGLASINVPEKYQGRKVLSVGKQAFYNASKVYVPSTVNIINEEAFSGATDVYLEGTPNLLKGSLRGIGTLHLLSDTKTIKYSYDDILQYSINIECDRKLVDTYRKMPYLKKCHIYPLVGDNECYVNFEVGVYGEYIPTVIVHKSEMLSPEVLKANPYLYDLTANYEPTQDYFRTLYEKDSTKVLPNWKFGAVDFYFNSTKVDVNMSIEPDFDNIQKTSIEFDNPTYNFDAYYTEDVPYVLPTIEELPRTGFSKITYTKDESRSSITELTTLSFSDGSVIHGSFELEDPVINSISNIVDDKLEVTYNPLMEYTLTPSYSHVLPSVYYTYKWEKDNRVSNSKDFTVKNCSDSGHYLLTIDALFIDSFGNHYYSSATRGIIVYIKKADVTIKEYTKNSVYDGNYKNFIVTLSDDENQTITYTYSGTRVDGIVSKPDEKVIFPGSYEVKVNISESDNYNEYNTILPFEILKRSVNVTIPSDMESIYSGSSESFDERYLKNVCYVEAINGNRGLVEGDSLNCKLSGLYMTNDRYNVGEYTITATFDNPFYDITYTPVTYKILKKDASVTFESDLNVVYGDILPVTYNKSGIIDIDNDLVRYGVFEYGKDSLASINSNLGYYDSGIYTLSLLNNDLFTNYNITTNKVKLTIEKRLLNVSREDSNLVYNGNLQTFNVYVTNNLSNHQIDDIVTITNNKNKDYGTYNFNISINNLYSNNYELDTYDNSYKILKKEINVNILDNEIVKGTNLDLNTLLQLDGVIDSDLALFNVILDSNLKVEELDFGTYTLVINMQSENYTYSTNSRVEAILTVN